MKNWFQRMTKKAQASYIKAHPNSIYASGVKRAPPSIMVPRRLETARALAEDHEQGAGREHVKRAGRWAATTAVSVGLTSVGLGVVDGAREDRLPSVPHRKPKAVKQPAEKIEPKKKNPKQPTTPKTQAQRVADAKRKAGSGKRRSKP